MIKTTYMLEQPLKGSYKELVKDKYNLMALLVKYKIALTRRMTNGLQRQSLRIFIFSFYM